MPDTGTQLNAMTSPVGDLFKAYCQQLQRAGIPPAENGYYIRWLKLYLKACAQQEWPQGDLGYLNLFLKHISDQAKTPFLKIQAAHAVKIYQQMSVVHEQSTDKPISFLQQTPLPLKTSAAQVQQGQLSEGVTTPPLDETKRLKTQNIHAQAQQKALLQAQLLCQQKLMNPMETPSETSHQIAWQKLYSQLEAEINMRHYSRQTLKLYRSWLRRFERFVQHKPPQQLNSLDVRAFLSDLATTHRVSAATQNQAFNALLFVFTHILKRAFIIKDTVRAKRKPYIPTVLSRTEIEQVLAELTAPYDLIVQLLYGCGLRLSECLKLRVQDLDFQLNQVTIHRGKGQKDRVVPLPHCLHDELNAQLETVKRVLKTDLEDPEAGAFLPGQLDKKYKQAHRQFSWQWLFPAIKLTWVPEVYAYRRHHLHATHVQRAIYQASQQAMLTRRASAHTFRHSYASHLLQANVDIRTIQHLLGHTDVRTTLIYLHTLPAESRRPACSPLDL